MSGFSQRLVQILALGVENVVEDQTDVRTNQFLMNSEASRRSRRLEDRIPSTRRGQPRIIVRRSTVGSLLVGHRVFLLGSSCSVGRVDSNDICIFDASVSRTHCTISRADDALSVSDPGSANGVFVNGEAVTATRVLQNGDRISIADDVVVFEVLCGRGAEEDDVDIAQSESDPCAILPVPLLAPLVEFTTAESELAKVKAAAQAVELHIKFALACALALRDPGVPLQGLGSLSGKPASMGTWLATLLGVVAAVSPDQSPVSAWLSTFSSAEVRGVLGEAVAARNRSIGHGSSVRDGAYRRELSALLDAIAELMRNLVDADLWRYRTVAVSGARVSLDSDDFEYVAHQACGLTVEMRARTLRTKHRLGEGWLYFIDESSSEEPIGLSPFFYLNTCRTCGQREVFSARRPVFGPKGTLVELEGITSGHPMSAPLAWDARAQALWSAMSARDPES